MQREETRSSKTEPEARILAALGHPARLEMVKRLAMAETVAGLSITELIEGTDLTRQATTKHLEALEDAGMVVRPKPGRATWYELDFEPIRGVIQALEAVGKQRARSQKALKSSEYKLFRKDP